MTLNAADISVTDMRDMYALVTQAIPLHALRLRRLLDQRSYQYPPGRLGPYLL